MPLGGYHEYVGDFNFKGDILTALGDTMIFVLWATDINTLFYI